MPKTKITQETFIERSKKIHNNKYDYSLVKYIDRDTPVSIICPIHGVFLQRPKKHLEGQGCRMCRNEKFSKNTNSFIEECKFLHGDKYDYSKTVYNTSHEKITVICHKIDENGKEHGEFSVLATNHINPYLKRGCPKCNGGVLSNKEDFILKAKKIHGDKYDYGTVKYINVSTPVSIICPKHGVFQQTPNNHLNGCGCPICGNIESKHENDICDFLSLNGVECIKHNRTIIKPYELDMYIPSRKIAIEYNGLYWHSEEFGKDKHYHLNKLEKCKENGIKLIQIFEDEYLDHRIIVENKLLHILGIQKHQAKVYGRKCTIMEISHNEAKEFLNTYHIQGSAPSTVYLGAFWEDKLIAVMTFKKEQKSGVKWELNRFASDYHYVCCGVGGKLFKYFTEHYNPEEIKSFADRRWTINEENNVYLQLGFKFDSYTEPDYEYLSHDSSHRIHKFNFRKKILHDRFGLSLDLTEKQMTNLLSYKKIWNCGLIKYIWYKNKIKK